MQEKTLTQSFKDFTFIHRSPSFSMRRFNITLPCSWYFSKEIKNEEATDLLGTLFHELSHFHHLIGTTYGVYYYIITFTQLIECFLYLRVNMQNGRKLKLPIKDEGVVALKNMNEAFLDYLEQSTNVALFNKEIMPDTIIDDKIDLYTQKEPLYEREKKIGKSVLLPTASYIVELNNSKKLKIPIGGHAIMENYAKHLEYMTGITKTDRIEEEHIRHYYYYFLTGYFLGLKGIPENIKNDLLSCLYYISLMGITPLITDPKGKYFGIFLKQDALTAVETVELLKYPGLVFYDALKATKEISENSTECLNDVESFLNQLCDRIQLPSVYELNNQLKKFIELRLDEVRKTSYFKMFPFVEYYLEMSLKFISIILNDPFSFIRGDVTKRTLLYLNEGDINKKVDRGFMGGYPVPNILFEHTYDNCGKVEKYTGMGDDGNEQMLLEFYIDIYKQMFSSNRLECYGIRHFSLESSVNKMCKKVRDCSHKKKHFNYKDCSEYHKSVLKMVFGDCELFSEK